MNETFKKIIERLEEVRRQVIFDKDWYVRKNDAINIVKEVAEEYGNDGWIPCSERLPEEYVETLGCGKDGHIYLVKMYDTKIYGKIWQEWNGGELRLDFIDAWQPLPKPYEPKGEENE